MSIALRIPGLAAALSTAALAACGGGGGGGDAPSPAPSPSPAPAPGPVAAPPPPPIGNAAAARFLAQAGFHASLDAIETVKASGYEAWLEQQFAMPVSTPGNYEWLVSRGFAVPANLFSGVGVENGLWRNFLSAPDTLRQRVSLALSEIFVISLQGLESAWPGPTLAAYVDMLGARAFGSFRELIEGVTLSCGMGMYLGMLNNQKADAKSGRTPDENFARELMQLMTIGLVELNPDGSPQLDAAGQPKPTYDQADVSNLAALLTGWTYDGYDATIPDHARKPMVHQASRFSAGAKKVLDTDVPASADGPAALKIALDTLVAHPNVGPFIGRQLIQRLVCSNPSGAYVQRVAAAFADNGRGQRGDMKAVLKAVLLDPEARAVGVGPGTGRLREPMLRFMQWGRTFKLGSPTGIWNIGDLSNAATQLGQSPLRSASVFNFFRPGYLPPNSALGDNGVTAPEFQLCNETSVAGYLNFMQAVIVNGLGEVKPDYSAQVALAGDSAALVEHLALLLAAGDLSAATKTTIATAVETIKATDDAGKLKRVQAAVLMVMACPEYLVQK